MLPYHVLTDTDSTCLLFVLVCKRKCEAPDKKFRNYFFEITSKNKVPSRFDTSDEFWERLAITRSSILTNLT